jgi:ATP-binding cassette subfamily B protein
MEHGQIIERGTHDELLTARGAYAQMWQIQKQQAQRAESN